MSRLRHRGALAIFCAAALAGTTVPAFAEVFAIVSPEGSYIGTRIVQAERPGTSAWTPLGQAQGSWLVLNANGDRLGDDPPVIAHDPQTGLPYVAWASRAAGAYRGISLATFDGRDWRPLPSLRTQPGRDAYEPALAIVNGRLLVAWTQGRRNPSVWVAWGVPGGTGGANREFAWSQPVQVSPAAVWAHSPAILVTPHQIVIASIGRGRPSIRFDSLPLVFSDATDGPMPLPPTGSSPAPPLPTTGVIGP